MQAESTGVAFDEQAYLLANPDVSLAIKGGFFASGTAHYESHGKNEGRPLRLPTAQELITPDIILRAGGLGREYGTSGVLHTDDYLLSYHLQISQADGLEAYFKGGAADARQAEAGFYRYRMKGRPRVLEFASGYGRVTRHLKIPNLTASDIHPAAVAFTRDSLKVPSIQAPEQPEDFNPGETFDYIFALSLFSHLPDSNFGRWLAKLIDLLTPEGLLMFTTHGEKAATMRAPELAATLDPEKGYGFLTSSDQPDLEATTEEAAVYGSTVVRNDYVAKQIRDAGGDLVSFKSRCWWTVQDEWVVRRWSA